MSSSFDAGGSSRALSDIASAGCGRDAPRKRPRTSVDRCRRQRDAAGDDAQPHAPLPAGDLPAVLPCRIGGRASTRAHRRRLADETSTEAGDEGSIDDAAAAGAADETTVLLEDVIEPGDRPASPSRFRRSWRARHLAAHLRNERRRTSSATGWGSFERVETVGRRSTGRTVPQRR
jgi:hypothetical protein